MSYILEALRKSERERQKIQASLIGSTPVDQPRQNSRWPVWTVSGLLLFNVLVLLFVFATQSKKPVSENIVHLDQESAGGIRSNAPPAVAQNGAATDGNESDTRQFVSPEVISNISSPPTQLEKTAKPKRIGRPPPIEPLPSATEPVRQSTAAPLAPAQSHDRFKPQVISSKSRKEEQLQKQANITHNPQTKLTAAKRTVNTPNVLPVSNSKLESEIAIKNDTRKAKNDIPLLREMPPDFQRRVPTLKVNVFAYSEIAEERFAIVNMVKYREGQAPHNGLVIEEIGQDSMVLRYEGKKFRYGTP